ncbi:MAG: ABC transporter substrate-binding protein [Gammaproteobacteria bacterium]|nr:ABC transporter substrate-binding protein [Gammaproteobacteria bacterium]
MVYRTGAYAPNGIPFANGVADYITLLNQNGGVNGVKINLIECETGYKTDVGVECYEKLKNEGSTGAAVFNPLSTGITYQLIPKAAVDKVPVHSMGYGQTAAADGRVFKWTFNFPTTYWSQASAIIKYIGAEEGGMENLKGKKIAHVFHNSPYGKEANPTLEVLAEKYGYELTLLPVDHPGQEQKATWLQIRRLNPDWVFMSGWGVMNQVAIKSAAEINYPMDHFIGNWWSSTEADVIPAGDGAKGYKGATFHGAGTDFPLIQEILKQVYDAGEGAGPREGVGEVLYNRGVIQAVFTTEAIRTAMGKFGDKPLSGEEVRWGLENLDLTEERLAELGLAGFTKPVKVTCEDHETMGPVLVEQWDGNNWNLVSDWIEPMRDVVRPMIEEAAAAYAAENNITPRDCSSES